MEKIDIIKSISERTGGDIYFGVVGAVRTGKSTFIKKFIENPNDFPILKLIVDKMGIQPDKINDYI